MKLFEHQKLGAQFLANRSGAMLAWEMGTGKTRTALTAALMLFETDEVDRVLVFCPAAVRFAWGEEMGKLAMEGAKLTGVTYLPDSGEWQATIAFNQGMRPMQAASKGLPICVVSYGLLQGRQGKINHVKNFEDWAESGKTLIIFDESSFLANRQSKQSEGAYNVACKAEYRWLLSGTPIANNELDLWQQGECMYPVRSQGPLRGFSSFWSFRGTYGMMGGFKGKEWFADPIKIVELRNKFKQFTSRIEKKDVLDLPEKTYTQRQITLTKETWEVYDSMRKDAMANLGDDKQVLTPEAGVRIMRLCQITSGFIGGVESLTTPDKGIQDLSGEKLKWLSDAILDGELSDQKCIIVWTRFIRERERLFRLLTARAKDPLMVLQIYGGQTDNDRAANLELFSEADKYNQRTVLIGQTHAGGYGLNLTQAHTAVYVSNDFSYVTRAQSEDRCHRIGQKNPVLYVDLIAVGPKGQLTVDYHVVQALKRKEDVAKWTCAAWKVALS